MIQCDCEVIIAERAFPSKHSIYETADITGKIIAERAFPSKHSESYKENKTLHCPKINACSKG